MGWQTNVVLVRWGVGMLKYKSRGVEISKRLGKKCAQRIQRSTCKKLQNKPKKKHTKRERTESVCRDAGLKKRLHG